AGASAAEQAVNKAGRVPRHSDEIRPIARKRTRFDRLSESEDRRQLLFRSEFRNQRPVHEGEQVQHRIDGGPLWAARPKGIFYLIGAADIREVNLQSTRR